MLPRYEVKPPPPLFRPRDIVHIITLAIFLVFLGFAFHKGGNPRTWRWVQALGTKPGGGEIPNAKPQEAAGRPSDAQVLALQMHAGQAAGYFAVFSTPLPTPGTVDAALAFPLHLEHVPLPEHVVQPQRGLRRSPTPDYSILGGAEDREMIWMDDPIISAENPQHRLNERKRRDADARYHLLQLAHAARLEDMAADARTGVRYSTLVEKPNDLRGDVIRIEGDLLWIKHFELNRPVPGLSHAYLGVVSFGRPDQAYWILFTELPPGLPPEKEWSELYTRDVKFDGYFLKVLRIDHPREQGGKLFVPLLVGKTVELPSKPEERWDFPLGPAIGAIAGFLVLAFLVVLWLRRGDRAHAIRLAAVRQRARESADSTGKSAVEADNLPEFRFDDAPVDPLHPPGKNGAQ